MWNNGFPNEVSLGGSGVKASLETGLAGIGDTSEKIVV